MGFLNLTLRLKRWDLASFRMQLLCTPKRDAFPLSLYLRSHQPLPQWHDGWMVGMADGYVYGTGSTVLPACGIGSVKGSYNMSQLHTK